MSEEQTFIYPPKPMGVDERILEPSKEFKSEVVKVAGAILFFVVIYLTLVAAACGLAVLCAWGGILLVSAFPKFITIMIGLGLVGLGIMVIYFLLKFIFKSNKVDRSGLIELKEKDQPELFSFIRQITEETQTPFPKRIYLSPDVNACVFYDSGFWSMFLPVKKNLQIGLGLVNSVNITEFKAILAHEFGHFSQRSMKLGSYVYNVNKVIFNMLYDNEGYGATLEKWASVSQYFAVFAGITIKIVQGIQWILQQVYSIVNKRYMSLSRQMEFHADAVAAYVTGSSPLVTSLRRLDIAGESYETLFNYYNTWVKENLKADNLYVQHTEVMKHMAATYNVAYVNGLPQVDAKSFEKFNLSRVVIKDQWASHPSTDEREEHLNSLNIETGVLHDSAWCVFRNVKELQEKVTCKIYENVQFKGDVQTLSFAEFKGKYYQEVEATTFDHVYNGYYDGRNITEFNPEQLLSGGNEASGLTFDSLFTEANCNLPRIINALERDVALMEQISKGDSGIKTFDFDGTKYKLWESNKIKHRLKDELDAAKEQLKKLDQKVFTFFYCEASKQGKEHDLALTYQDMFKNTRELNESISWYNQIFDELEPLYYGNLTVEDVLSKLRRINTLEAEVKKNIRKALETDHYFFTENQTSQLNEYISKERVYFTEPNFDNEGLNLMRNSLTTFIEASIKINVRIKKELFKKQLEMIQCAYRYYEDRAK